MSLCVWRVSGRRARVVCVRVCGVWAVWCVCVCVVCVQNCDLKTTELCPVDHRTVIKGPHNSDLVTPELCPDDHRPVLIAVGSTT